MRRFTLLALAAGFAAGVASGQTAPPAAATPDLLPPKTFVQRESSGASSYSLQPTAYSLGVGAARAALARIRSVSGEVSVRMAGGSVFAAAVPGQPLHLGDFLSTDVDSEAVLAFPAGTDVKVAELTQLRVNEMFQDSERARLQVFLRTGRVETTVPEKHLVRTDFSVVTPVATAAIRGTHQLVTHHDGRGTQVEFLSGIGLVESARGRSVQQSAGQKSSASADGEMTTPSEAAAQNAAPDLSPPGRTSSERSAARQGNRLGDRPSGDVSTPVAVAGVTAATQTPPPAAARIHVTVERRP